MALKKSIVAVFLVVVNAQNSSCPPDHLDLLQISGSGMSKMKASWVRKSMSMWHSKRCISTSTFVPGGSLDPRAIPKYVTPLVIPGVMKTSGRGSNVYDIEVRQFKQQILPGGHWNDPIWNLDSGYLKLPATTVWGYGPASDPNPDSSNFRGGAKGLAPAANSQFNYPAYTIEATRDVPITVSWINGLVKHPPLCKKGFWKFCKFLPHLFTVDQSLHWANPGRLPCVNRRKDRDCVVDPKTVGLQLQTPYKGPVPMVVHVHGGHTSPESDGYPEAWYLPDASNIPRGFARQGSLVNKYRKKTNFRKGQATFEYANDQPSATLWYHDHTLGMTRLNVYAGPAGFWIIRSADGGEDGLESGKLPQPAPAQGESFEEVNVIGRNKYRELPIAIQDRSFNKDGSLWYPEDRAFFEGVKPSELKIPFIGDPYADSDVSKFWNPEAFFNVMVVNGVSWPFFSVEPDRYRFRILNGCDSRFLNLALFVENSDGSLGVELPFYVIGSEQSLLSQVVEVKTGFQTPLPGNGSKPPEIPAVRVKEPAPNETALLLGPAERRDVIVDFTGLSEGTRVRMINTAPDSPFGGPLDEPADPETTGQIMRFDVRANTDAGNESTPPEDLQLKLPDSNDPACRNDTVNGTQDLALLEESSRTVCVTSSDCSIVAEPKAVPNKSDLEQCIAKKDLWQKYKPRESMPFGPTKVLLGIDGSSGGRVVLWAQPITENPGSNATEEWEFWNWSEDSHPIHVHLVKFKLVSRVNIDTREPSAVQHVEKGWKDTVIAYPGEITTIRARFDIDGLYVWHCHVLSHEDNEMMRPFCVGDYNSASGCNSVP